MEAYGAWGAADLRAAYEYLAIRPDIDSSRVIAVGDSSGGMAVVSFGLHAPPGLKAVVSFSGRWPTELMSPGACRNHTASTFGRLDQDTHAPMQWIYAKNDQLMRPKTVVKIHDAFIAAGGKAELATVERSGDDGHFIFSDSPQLWGPIVEQFLAAHDLPCTPLYPVSTDNSLKLPARFSDVAQKAFFRFQTLGPYKAFAIGPAREWAYSSGKLTLKLAERDALGRCRSGQCIIFAKGSE